MTIEDKILNQSLENCQAELDKFRWENKEVIGKLLEAERHLDVSTLFFKQGFLAGLKAARKNRETILKSL